MRRTILLIAVAIAAIGAGWSVGQAQATVADFEITIDAPAGKVNVICSRGCELSRTWIRTGNSSDLRASFSCSGANRCLGTVDGHGLVTMR
jgi:hypothetical protein